MKRLFCIVFLIILNSPSVLKAQGTVTDIDGNVYHTVKIGTQVWMVENLKTTKYRNGDPIDTDKTNTWESTTTGYYCWYEDMASKYKANYGALYNWSAVNDSRKIAPQGWHVPTYAEWTILINFLGNKIDYAGAKLKESGVAHWTTPNFGATNSSGFTALPGGFLYPGRYTGDYLNPKYATFSHIGKRGYWWSSTKESGDSAWHLALGYDSGEVYINGIMKSFGCSVRCLRD